jgi:ubiquinone/menaquinone biosynthesis C-methylase UbiE
MRKLPKDIEELKRIYNKGSMKYLKTQKPNRSRLFLSRCVQKIIGGIKGKTVLDVGCGFGFDTKWLAKKSAKVYAIDISDKMIRLAEKECRGLGVNFSVQDLTKTKFRSSFFDIIVSFLSITYCSDINKVWKEFRRILKNNGNIFIVVSHPVRKMVKYTHFNYFEHGKHYEKYAGFTRFSYYRTIEDFVNSAAEHELYLRRLFEPKIPFGKKYKTNEKSAGRINPDLYPHFLIFQLCKAQ